MNIQAENQKVKEVMQQTQDKALRLVQGCIKFPSTWYSYPPPLFEIFIFPQKFSVPCPISPLDILPNSRNIIGGMMLLPLSLLSTWCSSPQTWFSLSLMIHKFKFQTNLKAWRVLTEHCLDESLSSESSVLWSSRPNSTSNRNREHYFL